MSEFHVINLWHNGEIGEMNIHTGEHSDDQDVQVRTRYPSFPWYKRVFFLFVRPTKLSFGNYRLRIHNRGIRND